MEYRYFTNEELKWINSFQKIMKKAPDTLFMFVGGSYFINIFSKDENNCRYMNGSSVDGKAPCISIETDMECDGGDF